VGSPPLPGSPAFFYVVFPGTDPKVDPEKTPTLPSDLAFSTRYHHLLVMRGFREGPWEVMKDGVRVPLKRLHFRYPVLRIADNSPRLMLFLLFIGSE